jgi:hypothetical protein
MEQVANQIERRELPQETVYPRTLLGEGDFKKKVVK